MQDEKIDVGDTDEQATEIDLDAPAPEQSLEEEIQVEEVSENDKIFEDWSMRIVSLFNKYGVKIIAGTATPIGFLTPGYSLHKELELLVEAGLTPLQALQSATVTPAEFFNLESKMGTIEPGKYAGLVILNRNPLDSIKNTQNIHMVIAKGEIK